MRTSTFKNTLNYKLSSVLNYRLVWSFTMELTCVSPYIYYKRDSNSNKNDSLKLCTTTVTTTGDLRLTINTESAQ